LCPAPQLTVFAGPTEENNKMNVLKNLLVPVALLLLADQPHGGEEIQHLLSGQILFVGWKDVLFHAPVYACILSLWFACPNHARRGRPFYLLFAAAITSSVQLVGVFVVFASLILPALAATRSVRKLLVAWGCGITSVGAAIAISAFIDAPTGPVIVLSFAMTAVVIRVVRTSWNY